MAIKKMLTLYRLQHPNAPTDLEAETVLRAAESGDPESQIEWAIHLLLTDPHGAFDWTERAANQNYPRALSMLAWFYLEGIVVRKNRKKYFEISQRLESLDPVRGAALLGYCYWVGAGTKRDYSKAWDYMTRAFELTESNPRAQTSSEPLPDESSALADSDLQDDERTYLHTIVQNNMAMCYLRGIPGAPRDRQKAFELFSSAAEKKIPTAIYNLGYCYYKGWGVKKDWQRASELFQIAAEQGVWQGNLAYGSILTLRLRWIKAIPFLFNGGFWGKFLIALLMILTIDLAWLLGVFTGIIQIADRASAPDRYEQTLDSLKIGAELPFTGQFLDGSEYNPQEYKGKLVLIDFWATWCGPCLQSIDRLKPIYEKYSDKGFEIIGIPCSCEPEYIKQFTKENGIRWKQIPDDKARVKDGLLSDYCGVRYIPFTILLDRTGKVLAVNIPEEELEKKLKE